MRQIKPAGELPLIQHAFRCGVRSDLHLHIDDASAIRAQRPRVMGHTPESSAGLTVSVLRPAMITILPTAGVAGVPPMVVDDVCRSRGRSVY